MQAKCQIEINIGFGNTVIIKGKKLLICVPSKYRLLEPNIAENAHLSHSQNLKLISAMFLPSFF